MSDDAGTVTLTKMCLKHGIDMPREGKLAARFQTAFPAAHYDEEAGEWRMEWKKGSFAESNARLEAFFAENGVSISHIDRC
ncbi:hypothetical protein [Paracoccus sp. (in: a-proteobacteria)]|uniref:hypothetical protein n=1 Tax=Paracoccus sp. TaxID=267 RepID=UPI0028AC7FD5|nr:hypothetical protein [Paracoccus sp. (in: a-proteobacteria)]